MDNKLKAKNNSIQLSQIVKIMHTLVDLCGFINYLKSIQDIAHFIENLAPAGIETPNPEYPWEARKLVDNS